MVPFYSVMLQVTVIPAKFHWNSSRFRSRATSSKL